MPQPTDSSSAPTSSCPVDPAARSKWTSLLSFTSTSPPPATTTSTTASSTSTKPPPTPQALAANREISSIPRATSLPSNNEHLSVESQSQSTSPNWIYPSEQMFFAALKRKSHDPQAADMKTIVPIHNAVNERAWTEIKAWEAGRGSEKCGGPKLASFSGDSKKLTPKARLLTLMGYHPPFDRHDWTVDRCGKKIEYVIDFYTGKRDPKRPEAVSFYLDVRPKLQSFEGAKMRIERWVGGWFS